MFHRSKKDSGSGHNSDSDTRSSGSKGKKSGNIFGRIFKSRAHKDKDNQSSSDTQKVEPQGQQAPKIEPQPATSSALVVSGPVPVSVKPIAVKENSESSRGWAIAKTVIKTALRVLQDLGEDLPIPGKGLIPIILKMINTVEQVNANKEDFEALTNRCDMVKESIVRSVKGKDAAYLSPDLLASIGALIEGLHGAIAKVVEVKSGAVMAYIMTADDSGLIQAVNDTISRLLERFWLENHIAGTIVLGEILVNTKNQSDVLATNFTMLTKSVQDARLHRLSRAAAAYDSDEVNQKVVSCFEGTREALLRRIGRWASSPHGTVPPIYVLDGIAGIGKSTIAHTVATRAGEINMLGGSFFFSRDHEMRKTTRYFVSTLAFQLACHSEDFGEKIADALQKYPDAVDKDIRTQFGLLIRTPLRDLMEHRSTPLLIAIDALDECDEGQALALLRLLLDEVCLMPHMKVFLTTRPESDIRHLLEEHGKQELARFHVHDIEEYIVAADILIYLNYRLSKEQVKLALCALPPPPWQPTKEERALLVHLAGKLFIIAYTATEFILDKKQLDPAGQLSTLLGGDLAEGLSGSKFIDHMDGLYKQILISAAPTSGSAKWLSCYQDVVGAIIVSQNPLSRKTLCSLLGVKVPYVIRALENLFSIMAPAGDDDDPTFHIHHKSFSDFVTNSERCNAKVESFFIDTKVHHAQLAQHCFQTMEACLKFNICDFDPSHWCLDLAEIQPLVEGSIPKHLAYACTYWAVHLELGGIDNGLTILQQFIMKNILHWIEVLAFINRLDAAFSALAQVLKLLEAKHDATLEPFIGLLKDSQRFLLLNREIINTAPLHLYQSCLLLAPHGSTVAKTTRKPSQSTFKVIQGLESNWSPILFIFHHTKAVRNLAFSFDGLKLASATESHTVELWNTETGASIFSLQGHSDGITCVAFAPAPHTHILVSASNDGTIRLWDSQTGNCISILEGHSSDIRSIAFSPKGSIMASGSADETVHIWDLNAGTEVTWLGEHYDIVTEVGFSSDGSFLVSASIDGHVYIWETENWSVVETISTKANRVAFAVFSPSDSNLLAYSSDDATICLWNVSSKTKLHTFTGHSDTIKAVTFSPDGLRLATGSEDTTIQLWNVETGDLLGKLLGHSGGVLCLNFSPDSLNLVSGSKDSSLHLWDVKTGAFKSSWLANAGIAYIQSTVFSPDGQRIGSASFDGALCLWDFIDASKSSTTSGHNGFVLYITSSSTGSKFASTSTDKTVKIWDANSGNCLVTLAGHSSKTLLAVFSPDDVQLASGSDDGLVILWSVSNGKRLASFSGHKDQIKSILFSPDGTMLASGSHKIIQIWDCCTPEDTSQSLFTFENVELSAWPHQMAFTPDSSKLVSIGSEKTICLWDLKKGSCLTISNSLPLVSVGISPNGLNIISGDKSACVWNIKEFSDGVPSQNSSNSIHKHANWVGYVEFSPDGSKILSADCSKVHPEARIMLSQLDSDLKAAINTKIFCLDGMKMHSIFKLKHTLSSYLLFVQKNDSSMMGLAVVKIELGDSEPKCLSLCWFPQNINPETISVANTKVAIGCMSGLVLFLDISDISSWGF